MKSHSQNGEDLFVLDLYKRKNISSGFFFEFGAWDGIHLSNHKLDFKEIFRSPYAKSFISYQPIPKFLRNMTDVNGNGAKFLKRLYSLVILLILRPVLFIKYLYNKIK